MDSLTELLTEHLPRFGNNDWLILDVFHVQYVRYNSPPPIITTR